MNVKTLLSNLMAKGFWALIGALVVRALLRRAARQRRLAAGAHPTMAMTAMEVSMNNATAFPPSVCSTQINNLLNIFLWYTECPTLAEATASASKLLELKRCRSVALEDGWKLRDDIKAVDHVTMHTAQTEGEALTLLEDISKSKELPRDKPLWSLDLVKTASGRSVGLFRVHHVIGDGIGLGMELVPKVTTTLNGTPIGISVPAMPKQQGGLVSSLLWYLDALRSAGQVLGCAVKPSETDLPCLDPNRMDIKFSGQRVPVFFPVISLKYVKMVKEKAGGTVNDIIFAAWAGAMRKYNESQGFVFDKKVISRTLLAVAVPRNFPEGHDPEDRLTNQFAFVPVDLNMDKADPKELIRANKANLSVVKKTTIAPVSLWFTNVFSPMLPAFLAQQTAKDIFARHHLVFSNVPGPKEDICMFGKPIEKFQVVFYNVNSQMIAVSCGDKIFMNATVDPNLFNGFKQQFPNIFLDELDRFGKTFGVEGTCRYERGVPTVMSGFALA